MLKIICLLKPKRNKHNPSPETVKKQNEWRRNQYSTDEEYRLNRIEQAKEYRNKKIEELGIEKNLRGDLGNMKQKKRQTKPT